MRKILITMVASLLMTGGVYAEEMFCKVETKNKTFEKDILKCKEGDILRFSSMYGNKILWKLRACKLNNNSLELEGFYLEYGACIYRGSLREVR